MIDSLMIDSISNHCNSIIPTGAISNIWGMPESFASIFIPVGVTLLVFVIGQIIVWYRGQKTIQNETRNYREIVLRWIDLIKTSAEKNVEFLKDFSVRVAGTEEIHPERLELWEMQTGKIDGLGIDRIIRTFMINSTSPSKKSTNDSMTYNLIAQFGFLTSMESRIKENYESYQSRTLRLMDDWNVLYLRLCEFIDGWGIKTANPNHPLYSFHSQVHCICQKWQQAAPDGKSTMMHSMTNLVCPLAELAKNTLAKNANNEYAYELHKILEKIRFIDLQWNTSKGGDGKYYSDIATHIEESYKSLVSAKEYFEHQTNIKGILYLNK